MQKIVLAIVMALCFLSINAFAENVKKPAAFNQNQIQQVEKIVHDYLLANPQILVEVAQKLQAQETDKQNSKIAKIKENLPKFKKEIFDDKAPARTVVGNPHGKVTMVVISQYLCSHCKLTEPLVEKMIAANPDLKVIYLQWPFFGNEAIYAAKAALAADKQGKFFEVHKALFNSTSFLNKDEVDKIVKTIPGLDIKKLQKDMSDSSLDKGLMANYKLCTGGLGLIGTPTFIFANKDLTKFGFVAGQTNDTEGDLNKALNDVK